MSSVDDGPLPAPAAEAHQAQSPRPSAGSFVRHRGVVTLVDQVVVSLTNFSTGILIGRLCSREELGLYMLGYSVVLFAVALQQMLISSPFILVWPRLQGEAAIRYTAGAYSQQALFGGALSLCLLLASAVALLEHSRLAPVLASYALAAPFLLFKEMFRRVCFTRLKVATAVIADTAVGLLQVGLLLLVAHLHRLSAATGVLAVAIATSSLCLGLALARKSVASFEPAEARAVLRTNWPFGRWIFGSQLLWAASLYSYPWLISRFHGTAAAGAWAACFGINALGNPLLLGLQSYFEPRISHAFADTASVGLRRLIWQSTAVLLGSMLLFSLAIFVFGNRAVTLLYGAKYAGNGLTIFLITLSYAAGAGGFAFSCGFFAAGKGHLDLRVSWIYLLGLLACGIPLIARFGPLGGALSLVITNFASTLLRALQFFLAFRHERPGPPLPERNNISFTFHVPDQA